FLISLAACQQSDELSKVAKTKEELIGANFKADLALIEKATVEVDQLKYQMPKNKGKALNEIGFDDYQQTIVNRVAVDKGVDVVKVYAALLKSQSYQNLMVAQSKALTLLNAQISRARTASEIDMNTIFGFLDIELNNSQISEKSRGYIKSLKDALVTTITQHLQAMDKAATIENGQKVIKNYDEKALSSSFQSKISAIELEIIADGNIFIAEKQMLLLATSQSYEKANLLSNLFGGSATSNGRVNWSWRSFFKIVAVVVAVVVVAVAAPYVAAAIAPSLSGTAAITISQIAATVVSAGANGLVISTTGLAVLALTSVTTSYIGGQIYCASVSWDCNNNCSDSFSLYNSVKTCPFWD
ncbi:MAG: hypothetical protein ORN54_08685, partial [Cyclobacteriaceae bacterium]|nr:hypothetical protein [Cyclobacteriaceae bacterium]